MKASIHIAQMMIKLGVSTTKIIYLTQIYMIDQTCLEFVFRGEASCQRGLPQNQKESIKNMIWSKCPKRVYAAKGDLLFLFVDEMK